MLMFLLGLFVVALTAPTALVLWLAKAFERRHAGLHCKTGRCACCKD